MADYRTDQDLNAEALAATPLKAAQYVRMSTEHQQYSTENQIDVIKEYADRHGMEIVHTYADDGKSGLSIGGRNALKLLIQDVENGKADFSSILVYDVSRWGRFQDSDESANYEYLEASRQIPTIYGRVRAFGKYSRTRSISVITSTTADPSSSRRSGWSIPPISGSAQTAYSKL